MVVSLFPIVQYSNCQILSVNRNSGTSVNQNDGPSVNWNGEAHFSAPEIQDEKAINCHQGEGDRQQALEDWSSHSEHSPHQVDLP